MKHNAILGKSGIINMCIHMALFIPLLTQAQPKTVTIVWKYPPTTNESIMFEVWHSTTLTNWDPNPYLVIRTNGEVVKIVQQPIQSENIINWTLLATTTGLSYTKPATNEYEFFTVRAVDTKTKLVSGPAHD